jgi:hypothetical protein
MPYGNGPRFSVFHHFANLYRDNSSAIHGTAFRTGWQFICSIVSSYFVPVFLFARC